LPLNITKSLLDFNQWMELNRTAVANHLIIQTLRHSDSRTVIQSDLQQVLAHRQWFFRKKNSGTVCVSTTIQTNRQIDTDSGCWNVNVSPPTQAIHQDMKDMLPALALVVTG
jgi:hypothetical protein